MKVFITGGSGFVGGHVIERLAQRHTVLALARSEASADKVRALGAEPVMGDLLGVTAEQLRGCDAVLHCAAYVEAHGPRQAFWRVNVEGTTRLLDAARSAGVPRLLHVGTEAALFDGRDLVGIDETQPYPERQRFVYGETKAEAERRVLAANSPQLATLSIRPRLIWGPRDTSVLPVILDAAERGAFAWIDGGRARTSTTHVYNLVHALELALTRGEGGRAYFVSDEGERSQRELFEALAATRGVQLGDRSVPSVLARPLAAIVEGLWSLFRLRSEPPLTRFAAAMLSSTVTVRTERAQRELGYQPVCTVEEGLAELAA